jgi:hypothetical protein
VSVNYGEVISFFGQSRGVGVASSSASSASSSPSTITNPYASEIVRGPQWAAGKYKTWRLSHNYNKQQYIQESIPQHKERTAGKVLGTHSRVGTLDTRAYPPHTRPYTQKNAHKDTLSVPTEESLPTMATPIIDRRTKYRVGSPMLPVLPVETMPLAYVPDKFPDSMTHLEKIGTILSSNHVMINHMMTVYRFHAESKLDDRYITITTHAV